LTNWKESKQQANEKMNNNLPPVLSPRLWGDTYWGVMHNIAAAVQHLEASNIKSQCLRKCFLAFLCGIPFILPCLACRNNAPKFFQHRLSKATTETDLDLLMCDLHNDINKHLDKPIMSYDTAKQRVSDLNLFRVNTCQVWRFIVIVARSTDPQMLKTIHFGCTIGSLACVLRGLGYADLAAAMKKVLSPGCSMCQLFPVYKRWHDNHKLPCPETLADFITEHKLDETD
jgi:Erv1 / Alr family